MVRSSGRVDLRRPAVAAGQRILQWRFLAETYGELRKVDWPSRQEALRLTWIVIAISLLIGLLLGLIDFIFT
ncbi:MAG: preprotein translocase subunit SecE, partial [Chloroflexi bacterium]|nr:preprotein translocase subunit SecE [Chloroflexota bacterium]